ncbi:DUF1292 domain-containing protein [uncultured Finegoldia sp.]|uniref:DUF1292 domain-containing protein n=1 Tax=uncultured Finegoldia sp. TaxID=328009 RepID=UPI002612E157|nr:DUF1292 domain-containing protein [uncultured Finegoldia sp.]
MCDEKNLENEEMHEHEEELDTLVLTLEDGEEMECGILGVFEVEGYESDYIALVSEDDKEIMIYKYEEINDDEANLDVIEDDDEYEKAKQTFEEIFVDFEGEDEE